MTEEFTHNGEIRQYREISDFFFALLNEHRNFLGYPRAYHYVRGGLHTIFISILEYWAFGRLPTGDINPNKILIVAILDPKTQLPKAVEEE